MAVSATIIRSVTGDGSPEVLRLDRLRSTASAAPRGPGRDRSPRRTRLEFRDRRCRLGAREKGEPLTGPNPVDRVKAGSKLHVLTDAQGLPVVVGVSAANVNDVQALRPLVLGIPAVRSRRGPHRQRPDKVRADKAYHSAGNMVWLRERHITPRIAGRATKRQPLPGLARARRSHDLLQEARQDRHVRHRLRRADRLLRQLLRCCACLPGTPPGRAHQPPDLPW